VLKPFEILIKTIFLNLPPCLAMGKPVKPSEKCAKGDRVLVISLSQKHTTLMSEGVSLFTNSSSFAIQRKPNSWKRNCLVLLKDSSLLFENK